MKNFFILLCFVCVIINESFSKTNEEFNTENDLRSLKPTRILESKNKKEDSKIHSKLLQTLYSDSYSNNYYYTTLYIGPNKIKQRYLIDTTSAILSSPCGKCEECGKQKKNYYDSSNKKAYKPLKCSSKICHLVPASGCKVDDDDDKKKLDKMTCSFYTKKNNGDGLKGNYLSNIVYFEEARNLASHKKVYRSYALPIGCTTAEFGTIKSMIPDGVMGLNNGKGSFVNVLNKLKIVNKNLFSLCFGLEGGYMSLGEIDKTYHKAKKINYVPLLPTNNLYSFHIHAFQVGKNKKEKNKVVTYIDTTRAYSFFPNKIFKSIYNQIIKLCKDKKGKNICGKFEYDSQLGYCVSYSSRESLFKSVKGFWPNITFYLHNNTAYFMKGINYYYYYFHGEDRKACLGFKSTNKDFATIGTNFMHGKDIIIDKDHQKLGFVNADCGARNTYVKSLLNAKKTKSKSHKDDDDDNDEDIDKEIHKNEKKGKYTLGDEDNKDSVEFIQGHNTELDDNKDFNFFNLTVLLSSILIVVIVILIVIIALMCKKKEFALYQNISDEPNDFQVAQKIEEDTSLNDGKITSEEVQFLRKIMKITNK